MFVIFVTIIVTEELEFLDREYGNLFSIDTIEFWEYSIVISPAAVKYFVVLKVPLFFEMALIWSV